MKLYICNTWDSLCEGSVPDKRCYTSKADAMKRKERLTYTDSDGISYGAAVHEVELMDSAALVTREQHEAVRAERDQWRTLCGELMDAADEIRRIADTRMPRGGLSVVDLEGNVV